MIDLAVQSWLLLTLGFLGLLLVVMAVQQAVAVLRNAVVKLRRVADERPVLGAYAPASDPSLT